VPVTPKMPDSTPSTSLQQTVAERAPSISPVTEVEQRTGTHLAEWTKLYTSFNFIAERRFVLRPHGLAVSPIPRRIRWLGHVPEAIFIVAQFLSTHG
jgi:hypothetical protein